MHKARSKKSLVSTFRGTVRAVLLSTVALIPTFGVTLPLKAAGPESLQVPTPFSAATPLQIAQAEQTILQFDTGKYAVRVYTRGGATLMNVWNKLSQVLEVDTRPANFVPASGPSGTFTSYQAFGTRNSQPATYYARVNAVNNTLLDIFDAQNVLLEQSQGGPSPVVNLPAGQRPGVNNPADTVLAFSTASFANRVFREGGILKMNVYTRSPTNALQNGVGASWVQQPASPYERWVSYVSNGSFQGIPVQYFMRISPSGETLLELVDGTGRTILSQPGLGEVTINIPPENLPPGTGEPPAVNENLDPFIAAVFGNEEVLAEVQRVRPEARFESSRLGRFINAGSFRNRYEAEALVSFLRSRGFNSRLVYRNFTYR